MALTRITKGVIKPNENYDTHDINSTGIVTTTGLDVNGNGDISGNLSVGGVLTYEDVTSIDSVGIITAQKDVHVGAGVSAVGVGTFGGLVSPNADIDDFISVGTNIHLGNAGVITATSFSGSGANLTGIDATAIKDTGGNVKIQAQASGAVYTGIHTFNSGVEVGNNIKLGNAGVVTATTFVGALTGNATSADTVDVTSDGSAPGTSFPIFVDNNGSGKTVRLDSGLTYVPATNVLTAGTFSGSGASLTNLNGSNIASGTVPVARIGTGTKNSSTFYRGDGTFAVVTSVGGNTGVDFNDSVKARFGTGNDLEIFHDGTSSEIKNHVGDSDLNITCTGQGTLTLGVETSSGSNYKGISLHYLGKLEPRVHDSIDLGSSSKRFKNCFFDVVKVDSELKTNTIRNNGSADVFIRNYGATDHIKFRQGASQSDGWNIQTGGHFVPSNNSAYDIGQNASRVRNGYFTTVSAGSSISVGTGVTVESNGQATYVGIVTASAFKLSDGSAVGGVESDSGNNTVAGSNAGNSSNWGTGARNNQIFGHYAGNSLTTGDRNSLFGQNAGRRITGGGNNTALGNDTLSYQINGTENVAVGYFAANGNTGARNVVIGSEACTVSSAYNYSTYVGCYAGKSATGSYNVYLGYQAGQLSSGAQKSVAIGWSAKLSNTAANTVAIGAEALSASSSATGNTAVGYQAGKSNETGQQNTIIGYEALKSNTDSAYNVAIGYEVMETFDRADNGGQNTAVGWRAGLDMTDGRYNSCYGAAAGRALTSGEQNTIIGAFASAGSSALTGSLNTFIGYGAGKDSTTSGSNNTIIGCDAEASSSSVSNEITLGDGNVTRFRIPGIGLDLTSAPIANVVEDSSPQLGGDLASNGNNIRFGDSSDGSSDDVLSFGASNDLLIYHYSGSSYIQDNGTGPLQIYTNGSDIRFKTSDGEVMAKMIKDGAVELYHNATKKFETHSTGTTLFCTGNGNNEGPKIEASSSMPAILNFQSDAGAANNDKCRFYGHQSGGQLLLQDFSAGSFQNMANFKYGGAVELYHNGTKKFETGVTGEYGSFQVSNGTNGWSGMSIGGATVFMGNGTDAGIWNDTDNEWMIKCNRGAATELQYDGSKKFETTANGIHMIGNANTTTGNFYPISDNGADLGLSNRRWSNVYTMDLQLSNKGSQNSVDGTWGNYTIQEGESDLYLINNRSGKKYRFLLQEVS